MNKLVRLLALSLALILCALPCLAETAPEVTEAPAATEAPATEPVVADPNAVMVTVNGQPITRGEIDAIKNNLVSTYAQYGYDTTDSYFLSVMEVYALEYAIQLEIMDQKAVEWGFDKFTDEEKAAIEAENAAYWTSLVDQYCAYFGVTADSDPAQVAEARTMVISMLEASGLSEAILLEDAYESAKLERVEAEMLKDVQVSDEDVRAEYDRLVAADQEAYANNVADYEVMTQYYGNPAYYVPEGYRGVIHILLEVDETLLGDYQTLAAKLEEQENAADAAVVDVNAPDTLEAPVTQEAVDAAYKAVMDSVQPIVDEINKKLADGVPFEDLIVEYGADPGMEAEPNKSLGYSVHADSVIWDPVFTQAAFSVDNVGDVAEPVLGSYGVHIVKYHRDVPAGPVEFTAEVQNAIRESLLSDKENEAFSAVMAEWTAAAEIVYSAEAQAALAVMNEAE